MGLSLNLSIAEDLALSPDTQDTTQGTRLIEDGMELSPELFLEAPAIHTLEEVLEWAAETSYEHTNSELLDEALDISPALSLLRPLEHLISESMGLEVSIAFPAGTFTYDLEDSFVFGDEVTDEEVEAATEEVWDCWVLNTQELYPSVYSGFSFNSYAVRDGVTYAAGRKGIYKLSHDHSENFQTGIILPQTSFGSVHPKRFRVGYLGYVGDNAAVKAVGEDGSERIFKVTRSKFPMRRDQHGRRWKFSVAEFEALDFIELFPVILTRSR